MKWSVNKAAIEFGVSRETIDKGLTRLGVKGTRGDTYSTKQIHEAIAGDFRHQRTRREAAAADRLEMENARTKRELIPLEENLAWQNKVLLPIRQRLLSLSGLMASRCNPSDPAHAQSQLDAWTRESLTILRAEVAKAGE